MSKTVQQIECRDDIWKRVEALAKRRGVSTDEIVQAALIQLFTKKKEAPPASEANTPAPGVRPTPVSARPGPPTPGSSAARPLPRPASSPPGPPSPGRLPSPSPRAAPPTPAPVPQPRAVEEEVEIESVDRPLYLFFEGNWYTIDQEQYVIGRGSKFSDLPIKDANISRRHCAVMRRDGEYYMTDLGSTNGIEFAGVRVDNHMVEEGNVYYLCDHEMRFSFQAPY